MPNSISTIIGAGHDAFVNLYDCWLTFPTKLAEADIPELEGLDYEDHQQKLLTRIGNIQPPESSLGEYPIYYQSANINRPNAKITLNRQINLPFRVDAGYLAYKALNAWTRLYVGAAEGDYFLPSPSQEEYFGELKIEGFSSNTVPGSPVTGELSVKTTWLFKKVQCIDVSKPQFGRDAANPVEVTATFLFYHLVPPTYTEEEVDALL